MKLLFAALLIATPALSVGMIAVDSDRALLVGGSRSALRELTKQARRIKAIEGTIDVRSDADLIFDAGRRWSAKIPYTAISHLTYGVEVSRQARGAFQFFPWPGSSQFTDKPHYLLTVIYMSQTGTEESQVFELGKSLVRPVFEALERRTAIRVEFLSVDACMALKSAKDCGFGSPDELRGLKRVHIDTRGNAKYLEHIVTEIEKSALGLQIVTAAQEAEISLKFHGEEFFESGKGIDGGRGEVTILRNPDPRVVLVFTDRDTSIWGRAPSLNFGGEFVKAYKKANVP